MRTSRQNVNNRLANARTILGLRFFLGTAAEAVARTEAGGLVLIPAAPALKDISTNHLYRDALLSADTLLTDSAFMVLIWNMIERDNIHRLSGLAYLRELLHLPSFQAPGNTLWILPKSDSVARTSEWLATTGISVPSTHFYVAPIYKISPGKAIDPALIDLIERLRPRHIVLGIGGGTQEPLGADLKHRLTYLPSIHCVGAAIAFLTGEQVAIPVLADRLYLGWFFRTIRNPLRFSRRYWEARKLLSLLLHYRDRSPDSSPLSNRIVPHPTVVKDSRG
jgi:N-acetylglucosaminyldiphosphoundecaprenol N-acetyl-beta-D-mannosaminyltransferase